MCYGAYHVDCRRTDIDHVIDYDGTHNSLDDCPANNSDHVAAYQLYHGTAYTTAVSARHVYAATVDATPELHDDRPPILVWDGTTDPDKFYADLDALLRDRLHGDFPNPDHSHHLPGTYNPAGVHHHHTDDGGAWCHSHDPDAPTVVLNYHDNEYHWPNHYHHLWDTPGNLVSFGAADHDHDTPAVPAGTDSDIRT